MAQDSESGGNAIRERPEETDCDSCEGLEGAEAEAGRRIRRPLPRCLDHWSAPALHSLPLGPFFFCEALFLSLSLIVFSHSSPYDYLFKNPNALLVSLKAFCKAHFSHEV